MTGYGRGEAKAGRKHVEVEVRTVNHRFIDFSIRLPRALGIYEKDVEKIAKRKLKRGHIYITVTVGTPENSEDRIINRENLRRAYEELTNLALDEGIPGTIDINTVLSLPDVFAIVPEEKQDEELWSKVQRALSSALSSCVRMRRAEGHELFKDISKRLLAIGKFAAGIEKRAPKALDRALSKTRKRIEALVRDSEIDESRWGIEAAVLADRTDFSEELVRLKSHLQQFGRILKKGGEVSKKLTFLLQEIHREATTMGNKSSDSVIIRDCLAIKEEVEKIREQVQNLE
jgi:uncharacterized protein (TIGR00255 family)